MKQYLNSAFPPILYMEHDCDVPLERYYYFAVQDNFDYRTYHLFVYRKNPQKTERVFFTTVQVDSNPADWPLVSFIYESEFDDYLFICLSDSTFFMLKNVGEDKFFVYEMPIGGMDIITVEEISRGKFIFNCRASGNDFVLKINVKADVPFIDLSMSAQIAVEPNVSSVGQYESHFADAYIEQRKKEMEEWVKSHRFLD